MINIEGRNRVEDEVVEVNCSIALAEYSIL